MHAPVGELIADCHIDLPPNDVVDSINFERFFRISATLGQITPDISGKIYDAEPVTAASYGVGGWTHVRGPRPSPAPQTGAFANIPGLRLALHMPFGQLCDGLSFADIARLVNSNGTFHIDRPDLEHIREARLDGLYALCL